MAIATGPLFSQEARGKFANSMVFRRRKGQNVVSAYVTPANPKTPGQLLNRGYVAATSQIINKVNALGTKLSSEVDTIKQWATARAVGTNTWANYLVSQMQGTGNSHITASKAAYDGLGNSDKTAWDGVGEDADFSAVSFIAVDGTTYTSGFLAYLLQRTVRQLGYGTAWVAAGTDQEQFTT